MADSVVRCEPLPFEGSALEAADGTMRLRRMFIEIKRAPKLIKRLNGEFRRLEIVYRQIAAVEGEVPHKLRGDLLDLIVQAFEHVSWIVEILFKYTIKHGDGCANGVWHTIAISEHRSSLEERLHLLKESTSTIDTFISRADVKIVGGLHNELQPHFAEKYRFQQDELEPFEIHNGANNIYYNSFQTNEARPRYTAPNPFATTNGSENIFYSAFAMEETVSDSSTAIIDHVDKALRQLSDNLPLLIDQGIRKHLEDSLENLTYETKTSRFAESGPVFTAAEPKERSRKSVVEVFRERTGPNSFERKRTFSRTIPVPFGLIQIKAVTESKTSNQTGLLRLQVEWIPFRWLSSCGKRVSINKVANGDRTLSWNVSFRTYNTIPKDSPIFQACRKGDIEGLKQLFKYRAASPFDVDSSGASILSYACKDRDADFCESDRAREIQEIIKFLIREGVEPDSYVKVFLNVYGSFANWYRFMGMDDGLYDSDEVISGRILDDTLRICLDNCNMDPFIDTDTLLLLWEYSLAGSRILPLDSSHLFRDDLAGLDELTFEHPDRIFTDLLKKHELGFHEQNENLLNQSFEALAYMCRGGKESLKAKIFSAEFAKGARRMSGYDSCFCEPGSTHLLFKALHDANLFRHGSSRVSIIKRHVRRMLTTLIDSGEDPEVTCGCKTSFQTAGEHRLLTDVAASEGLLETWAEALDSSGFDSTRIIDKWRYQGLEDLFKADEVLNQGDAGLLSSHVKMVGSILYTTITSIV